MGRFLQAACGYVLVGYPANWENVFMKPIALMLILLAMSAYASDPQRVVTHRIDTDLVMERIDDLYHVKGEKEPFTGVYINYHWGQKILETHYVNGTIDVASAWYGNGQKKSETLYSDNKRVTTGWYENGLKKSWAGDGVTIQDINYFNLAYPARQAIIRMNEPGWLMTNTRRRMA